MKSWPTERRGHETCWRRIHPGAGRAELLARRPNSTAQFLAGKQTPDVLRLGDQQFWRAGKCSMRWSDLAPALADRTAMQRIVHPDEKKFRRGARSSQHGLAHRDRIAFCAWPAANVVMRLKVVRAAARNCGPTPWSAS
jgi:hypothetical protein